MESQERWFPRLVYPLNPSTQFVCCAGEHMLYGTLAERSCWLSQNISGPYQPKLFMTFRMLKINVHKAGLDTTDRTDKATGTSVVLRRHTLTRLPRRTFLRGAGILMSGRAASAVGRAQHQGGSACVGQRPMRARNGLMSLPVFSGYMQTSLKEMPLMAPGYSVERLFRCWNNS